MLHRQQRQRRRIRWRAGRVEITQHVIQRVELQPVARVDLLRDMALVHIHRMRADLQLFRDAVVGHFRHPIFHHRQFLRAEQGTLFAVIGQRQRIFAQRAQGERQNAFIEQERVIGDAHWRFAVGVRRIEIDKQQGRLTGFHKRQQLCVRFVIAALVAEVHQNVARLKAGQQRRSVLNAVAALDRCNPTISKVAGYTDPGEAAFVHDK